MPGGSRARASRLDNGEDITAKTNMLSIEDAEEEEDDNDNRTYIYVDLPDEEGDTDATEHVRELTPGEVQDLQYRLARPLSATPAPNRYGDVRTATGGLLTPGLGTELSDGDFLVIDHISYTNHIAEPILRGMLFRRTNNVDDMLPKKYNEICAILKARSSDTDPSIDDCLVSRSVHDVLAVREIILTNRIFPALSFRERAETYNTWDEVKERAVLVCRWKHTEFCDIAKRKVTSQSLVRLREHECTLGKGVPDMQLKQMWRGATNARSKGKSKAKQPVRESLADLDFVEVTKDEFESQQSQQKRPKVDYDFTEDTDGEFEELETKVTQSYKRVGRSGTFEKRTNSVTTERFKAASTRQPTRGQDLTKAYTYGDICTGAGGMASGAKMAGLDNVFFLDYWPDACKTLKMNFHIGPFCISIHEFCTVQVDGREYRVDVLHISYACQPHSPAHTVEGKDDEKNIASAYSVMQLLEICKPRIVTFEQTPGIITHRGGFHYRSMVHQLTCMNYSLRSKIVNCAEYEASQARKRLIIIASCPGEPLPNYPAPTHGSGPGMKPRTTIHKVFSELRHFPIERHMRAITKKTGTPYDDNKPLDRCITTNGGDSNLHPNGKRSFNLQELACLAGFPRSHRFFGNMTSIKKQIGNAVPACFAKALFEEITKTMRATDAAEAAWEPETIVIE